MEPPTPQPDPDLAALVNDYLDLIEATEKNARRKEELTAEIVAKVPPGGKVEVLPGVGIRVQHPARRWSDTEAEKILTADQLALITVTKLSGTKAADMLPGALVDLCKVPGTRPTVVRL
jgi:hypothetical protein